MYVGVCSFILLMLYVYLFNIKNNKKLIITRFNKIWKSTNLVAMNLGTFQILWIQCTLHNLNWLKMNKLFSIFAIFITTYIEQI